MFYEKVNFLSIFLDKKVKITYIVVNKLYGGNKMWRYDLIIFVLLISLVFLDNRNIANGSEKAAKETRLIEIKMNLEAVIEKHKAIALWPEEQIEIAAKVLYIGETNYKMDTLELMALISLESYFNPFAIGRNKKSVDYGLTQQNSKYIVNRFKYASKVLTAFNIEHDTNDYFDVGLNLMACIVFKATINKQVNSRKKYLYPKSVEKIVAYNLGLGGVRIKSRSKIGYRYYRIYRKRMEFCSII
jgi:hypothetical protein